jgi:transcription-repair coupling factor (superfamily II helicase)
MNNIIKNLTKNNAVTSFLKGDTAFTLSDTISQALLLATVFSIQKKTYLVVCNSLYNAQKLHDSIVTILQDNDECLLFPSDESLRVEALASSPELLTQRVYVMNKLIERDKPRIIIAHTSSIVRHLPSVNLFKNSSITVKVDSNLKFDTLALTLLNNGYKKVGKIDSPLQFAQRGNILDIYSVNYENPIRIEFFGDIIDSIRFFDLTTQRTISSINQVTILPSSDLLVEYDEFNEKINKIKVKLSTVANETLVSKCNEELEEIQNNLTSPLLYKYYHLLVKETSSIIDYIDDCEAILIDLGSIKESYNVLLNETFEYIEEFYINNINVLNLNLHHDLLYTLDKAKKHIAFNYVKTKTKEETLHTRDVNAIYGSQDRFAVLVKDYLDRNIKIVFCLDNAQQAETLTNWVRSQGYFSDVIDINIEPTSNISYMYFGLVNGFELVEEKIVYISSKELFGTTNYKKTLNTYRYKDSVAISSYENLNVGDYVVHVNHGIGQYLGLKTIEVDGVHRDYLHIAYKDNNVLYVPLEQFQLVRKFVSKEGVVPKLNKLGGTEWNKTKAKIKNRVKDIASRLIKLYSTRALKEGHAFSKDSEYQIIFENNFPYELTPDQRRSIDEIKADMESSQPMDRLLCGDVGFGKTEVAFVAAFKAILDSKQVALLCPTTLLARQHLQKAKERFQNFPINVAMVSRFVSDKEIKEILRKVKTGEIDFLIGTHRILSKDVQFKDLGLLIIDEEQRFGVEHKEKIKELKESIDVLTLSATPIPRTLQMALLGIRNLSQIDTPPLNRMPIQTYVIEKNMKVIKEIIERELGRNGQVFYLYNKTSDISFQAEKIAKLVPSARVIFAHGKMSREQMEDAMVEFYNHNADIMVCTTIVENGIDIPNANTIIIEDADKFGLAQLYQIKGRVGRSDRLAYAYLLYSPQKQMNEVATKRLKAIKEFTELGSGYRIAMRDLSIRGAGDILGAEQAGFIDTVGIDMYIRLLKEAIEEEKTGKVAEEPTFTEKAIIQKVDAYIPERFSSDDLDKIEIYQKIDECKSVDDLDRFTKYLVDLYGRLPINVELLLQKRRLELLTDNQIIENLKDFKDFLTFNFKEEIAKIDGIGFDLFSLTMKEYTGIRLNYKDKLIKVRVDKQDDDWLIKTINFIEKANKIIAKKGE